MPLYGSLDPFDSNSRCDALTREPKVLLRQRRSAVTHDMATQFFSAAISVLAYNLPFAL